VAPTPENIDIWMRLLADTLVRDDFGGNNRTYYENFLYAPGVYMAFARLDRDILAAGIFVQNADVGIYYYGASTSDADLRKHKAPYLLQYTAMCYMQSLGCTTYDMLGVCPLSDTTHRLYGVSDFKEKFGGEVYMLPPKKMYILRKYAYMLFTLVRTIKGYIYN
jgi:lipid II:glycine glycyltransferase (peptidoglycan interpeptide bridge formation enzyme)